MFRSETGRLDEGGVAPDRDRGRTNYVIQATTRSSTASGRWLLSKETDSCSNKKNQNQHSLLLSIAVK